MGKDEQTGTHGHRLVWHMAKHIMGCVVVGLSTAACKNSSGPVPAVYSAVVYGVVSNASGLPLSGVQVQSETYSGTCASGQRTGSSSPTVTTTDATGLFYQQIVTGDSSSSQCLRVILRPKEGGSRVGAEVTGLRLKAAADASLPYDSLRVDITLP